MSIIKTLTGIKPTGIAHLGNYVGAIKPSVDASNNPDGMSYFFIADYHAIISCWDPRVISESTRNVAATWLALGLDPDHTVFYRQSDIPQIPELCWILTCVTAKGLMNRSHAYKAAVQYNTDNAAKDSDKAITMGLYSYPILMAADILIFNATHVPVGKDQIQHLEMVRDIAGRFNHHFGHIFTLPEPVLNRKHATLAGLDGRKMSKSYDNVIPLFCTEKQLRKYIMKIKTNSLEPGEPKDSTNCTLFQIFSAFASSQDIKQKQQEYDAGAGWGALKQSLFEYLNEYLKKQREEYNRLIAAPGYIEEIFKKGADKAKPEAQYLLGKIRKAIGISALT